MENIKSYTHTEEGKKTRKQLKIIIVRLIFYPRLTRRQILEVHQIPNVFARSENFSSVIHVDIVPNASRTEPLALFFSLFFEN